MIGTTYISISVVEDDNAKPATRTLKVVASGSMEFEFEATVLKRDDVGWKAMVDLGLSITSKLIAADKGGAA